MFNKYALVLYRDTCSSVLEESLRKLGVEKPSKEGCLEDAIGGFGGQIRNWIHFMHIAISTCLEFEQIW